MNLNQAEFLVKNYELKIGYLTVYFTRTGSRLSFLLGDSIAHEYIFVRDTEIPQMKFSICQWRALSFSITILAAGFPILVFSLG